jgi:predicted transposase/invertase (TIGR01784 family)
MARVTLDPTLDVIFKLLFAHERNRDILISFLTAVLKPLSPVASVEILNPEVPSLDQLSRRVILDIHVRFEDGSHVVVEMQAHRKGTEAQRVLCYWGRVYSDQLPAGGDYKQLRPVLCIVVLGFSVFDQPRFHKTFRVLEVHDHEEFSKNLEIHTLELPKLEHPTPDTDDEAVLDWGRFFAAQSDEELEILAMNNPDLARATEALHTLSADPKARELARARELAEWEYQAGLELAKAEGEARGKAEGLRDRIQHYCERFGIELTDARQDILAKATVDELRQLMDAVVVDHKWPAE